MGYSRWEYADTRTAYAASTVERSTKSAEQIFTTRQLHESLDPAKVILRESRDSEHNPESNAIIIGLDVTGSMGIIAEKMARGKLGELMEAIYAMKPVTDPHVMVMGIGDACANDQAPLQASQFEADIKIDLALQNLYREGGGGGNDFESYDLPWYFAATRTAIDCFDKRGKKGYLFTIGDEYPPQGQVSQARLAQIFGNSQEMPASSDEALAKAQEQYNVFHIVVEQGSFARQKGGNVVLDKWRQKIGKRAIPLRNWEHISEVILAAMQLSEGESVENVIAAFQAPDVQETLKHSFA